MADLQHWYTSLLSACDTREKGELQGTPSIWNTGVTTVLMCGGGGEGGVRFFSFRHFEILYACLYPIFVADLARLLENLVHSYLAGDGELCGGTLLFRAAIYDCYRIILH
jgi:hypothetical protein